MKEVVSFTHTYAGEVVDGEEVVAKGKVEKVIKNGKDSHKCSSEMLCRGVNRKMLGCAGSCREGSDGIWWRHRTVD